MNTMKTPAAEMQKLLVILDEVRKVNPYCNHFGCPLEDWDAVREYIRQLEKEHAAMKEALKESAKDCSDAGCQHDCQQVLNSLSSPSR